MPTRVHDTNSCEVVVIELVLEAESCRELGDVEVLFVQRVEASHRSWHLGKLFGSLQQQRLKMLMVLSSLPSVLFSVADQAFLLDTSRRRVEKVSLDLEVLELTHPRANIAFERFQVLGLLLELLLCLVFFLKFRHRLCATVRIHAVDQLVVGLSGVLADLSGDLHESLSHSTGTRLGRCGRSPELIQVAASLAPSSVSIVSCDHHWQSTAREGLLFLLLGAHLVDQEGLQKPLALLAS